MGITNSINLQLLPHTHTILDIGILAVVWYEGIA
jgi:hypothetical protein